MPRLLKIILSIFASIIILVIIAAIALPFFIDPNDYKSEIQSAVKENIGRDLKIDGDLKLSVFPWIGITTGKLTLSNAQGFTDKPFAIIEESDIKVKLLPLLSKQVEVSRVVLKGLVLNLAKNKRGMSNWADLSSSDDNKTQATDKTEATDNNSNSLAALAIGGIVIEQATIVWDDKQQNQYIEINDFNFNTGKFAIDKPIDVSLSLTVLNKQPELTESLDFSTELVINNTLDVFKFNELVIKSITRGKDIPGDKLSLTLLAEVILDLPQQTLDISGLKLNTANINLSADIRGTNVIDNPVFKGPVNIAEFNLAQTMNSMAMPLPKMQDSTALNKLSLAFNLLATTRSADFQSLSITLDDTHINGSASIHNFSNPAIKFNLKIDAINVDRYLSAESENPDESSNPAGSPASNVAASATLFPVDTLRALNAEGHLSIDNLTVNQLKMQGVKLKLDAKRGLIKTEQSITQFYQGAYTGNTTINVKNTVPTLAIYEKLSQVQLAPLLNDILGEADITGIVNASARLKGKGNTSKALKSTLNGKVDVNIKNGVVKGFNLQQIIENKLSLIKTAALLTFSNKNNETKFSIIKGSAKIYNGLISNDDLYAEAEKLRVNGNGTANLVSEKINYMVEAKLLKKVATKTSAEKFGSAISINIGGTFSNPVPTIGLLEITEIITGKHVEKLEQKKDELLKKLDEKIGSGVGDLLKGLF